MNTLRNPRGLTLTELVIVVAFMTVIGIVFVRFFARSSVALQRTRVRQQTTMESRVCMDTIIQVLREGKANSMSITTPPGSPMVPNSRIDFNLQNPLPSGATWYAFYLSNRTVYAKEGLKAPRALATNVGSLMFSGDAKDPAIVTVSLEIDTSSDQSNSAGSVTASRIPDQVVHMSELP